MRKLISVSIANEGCFKAYKGDTLLDAALANGFDLPHDCRAGICGSCRVQVVSGSVDGNDNGYGSVLACQAKIRSPLQIAIDDVPPIETVSARVKMVRPLTADVVEVTIEPSRPIDWLAGQYCQFRFAGFPTRSYSPTAPLEGPTEGHLLRLHIRRVRNGRVSSALGTTIRPGHRLKIVGPYGSAYLRPAQSNRLILVSSGTGFAPIWSIAYAALIEMPDRPVVVLAGARTRNALYMGRALIRLLAFPKVKVMAITAMKTAQASVIRSGSPVDHMPQLNSEDIVHVAGSPALVKAVEAVSRTARATCFADAFVASENQQHNLLARMRNWLAPSAELIAASL
jgi:3-phenylpropionate/trans-cinnamate dioxygenase ferredoxin reductase subunit